MELDDKDTHTMRSAESSRAKMWSLLIKAGGIRISRIGLTVLDAITTEGALYDDKAKEIDIINLRKDVTSKVHKNAYCL